MADLPSLEQVTTGGLVAAVVGATGWIISKLRGAVDDGETLAERRIAALTSDIDAYRARTDATIAGLDRLVHDYRTELIEADKAHRREMGEVRAQLRQCRADYRRVTDELDQLRHPGGPAA